MIGSGSTEDSLLNSKRPDSRDAFSSEVESAAEVTDAVRTELDLTGDELYSNEQRLTFMTNPGSTHSAT